MSGTKGLALFLVARLIAEPAISHAVTVPTTTSAGIASFLEQAVSPALALDVHASLDSKATCAVLSHAAQWKTFLIAPLNSDSALDPRLRIGGTGRNKNIESLLRRTRDRGVTLKGETVASLGPHVAEELQGWIDFGPEVGRVIGVEVFGSHLERMGQSINENFPVLAEKVRLYQADVRDMPLIESGSLAVVMGMGLVLPGRGEQAAREILRILKPGGMAQLSLDLGNPDPGEVSSIYNIFVTAGALLEWSLVFDGPRILFQKNRLPGRTHLNSSAGSSLPAAAPESTIKLMTPLGIGVLAIAIALSESPNYLHRVWQFFERHAAFLVLLVAGSIFSVVHVIAILSFQSSVEKKIATHTGNSLADADSQALFRKLNPYTRWPRRIGIMGVDIVCLSLVSGVVNLGLSRWDRAGAAVVGLLLVLAATKWLNAKVSEALRNPAILKTGSDRAKSLRHFSTLKADYRFHYGSHHKESIIDEVTFGWMDAVVLEGNAYLKPDKLWKDLTILPQYRSIVRVASARNTPLYFPDLPITFEPRSHKTLLRVAQHILHLIVVLSTIPTTLCFLILPCAILVNLPEVTSLPIPLYYILLTLSVMPPLSMALLLYGDLLPASARNRLVRLSGLISLTNFYEPVTGMRSAVAARKIEDWIVPELSERLGRRPRLLIDYGAGHADIEFYLKYKTLRNAVIRYHRITNYAFAFFSRRYLDKVAKLADYVSRSVEIHEMNSSSVRSPVHREKAAA